MLGEPNDHYNNFDEEETCSLCSLCIEDLYYYNEDLYCEECLIGQVSYDVVKYLLTNEISIEEVGNLNIFLSEEWDCFYENCILNKIEEDIKVQFKDCDLTITNINNVCHRHLSDLETMGVDKFIQTYLNHYRFKMWSVITRRTVTLFYNHTKNGKLYI